MNQENFEQAYVESQAQIALVLAESLGLIEGYSPARVINFPRPGGEIERVVSRGRTGRDTGTHRLVDPNTGKATKDAKEKLKQYTAGPKRNG